MKKFVVYEIRNKINEMIYVGAHVTENVNDSYMGSGSGIRKAIKEFGLENFEKKILHIFDNKEEMLKKEFEIVNEKFLKRKDVYNLTLGGGKFGKLYSAGFVTVKDEDGKTLRVKTNDSKYLSGDFRHVTKGTLTVKDEDGNHYRVDKYDPKYLSGELKFMTTGSVCVKDENGNKYRIDKNDPKYLSGELQYIAVGHVTVKDDNGKTLRVKVDDERYLSGDLISIWNGKKHNDETKNKMSAKAKMRTQEKNSQFGTCWIFSDTLKENKKILKSDLQHFLNLNWLKGRKY